MRYFLVCLLLYSFQGILARPYLKIQQIRSTDYPYIKIEVSVSKITPIKNLNQSNFELYENNWNISSFQVKRVKPNDDPKTIILLVDSSKSLKKNQFNTQIQAVNDFTQTLNANDRVSIISFDSKVKNHCGFVSERQRISACIKNIKQEGENTLLYDAIFEALNLGGSLEPKRHSIVLFTDGLDEGSVITVDDLVNKTFRINTPLFIIGTGHKKKLSTLSRLARVSGGEIYHIGKTENLSRIYLLLNYLFDNNYLIKYISQASDFLLDDQKVELKIRLKTEQFQEEDSSHFFLPAFSFDSIWKRIQLDKRYFYFFSGILGFLLILVILVIIFKKSSARPKTKKEKGYSDKEESIYQQEPMYQDISRDHFASSKSIQQDKISAQKIYRSYAYLIEKEGPNTGKKYDMNWSSVTIGYSDENSIVIHDPMVSYKHAKIVKKNESFILYDYLSEYGTYLNNKKLLRPRELEDSDEIKIGRTKLIFRKGSNLPKDS